MDQLDRAQQEHDLHLSLQLKHRQPTLQPKGVCHWCDHPTEPSAQFCSSACRDDHAQYERKNGVRS